jgi:hypothetical protein
VRRALSIFCALVACSPQPAAPDAGPRALAVDHVDDLGAFSAPATVVGRDGTTSALLGDRIVWTFGDTFLTKATPDDGTSVRSSTAGWSAPDAALALDEQVDDGGVPFQLVPYTAPELAQNQTAPQNGVALWPTASFATSATNVVIVFQHVIRASGGFAADAIGTAELAKDAPVATRDPSFLFQSPEPLFGNGGVATDDTFAYFFECESTGVLDDGCKVARAPVASVTSRSAFQFWDGAAYQSDVAKAAVFIDHASYALSITFNPWLGRWLAVYGKPLSDDVGLRAADHLEGPWTDPEVVVPGATFVTGDAGVNYLAREHVELRSSDGKTIVIGYAHPLPNFGGACRLARIVLR